MLLTHYAFILGAEYFSPPTFACFLSTTDGVSPTWKMYGNCSPVCISQYHSAICLMFSTCTLPQHTFSGS